MTSGLDERTIDPQGDRPVPPTHTLHAAQCRSGTPRRGPRERPCPRRGRGEGGRGHTSHEPELAHTHARLGAQPQPVKCTAHAPMPSCDLLQACLHSTAAPRAVPGVIGASPAPAGRGTPEAPARASLRAGAAPSTPRTPPARGRTCRAPPARRWRPARGRAGDEVCESGARGEAGKTLCAALTPSCVYLLAAVKQSKKTADTGLHSFATRGK